ncbi:MAG: flagellar basal body-associated FliL family protein [Syntrophales bacterium]|jgi:flagellar basal body-associated protein FliL|nr:flagellar basal body-associated FliL family protein [Syntrophales bacterium]
MARRVELDLLEGDGVAEAPKAEPAGPPVEAELPPPVRASLMFRLRFLLQKTFSRFRHPKPPFDWKSLLNWKVLAAGLAAVVLLSGAVVSFLVFRHQESERVATEQKAQAVAPPTVVREAAFPDFSIDIKDAKGRYRFLQCDVTVEFHEAVALTEDRKVEIRRVIYLAAKKKGPEWIASPDSGKRFKKEVREELRAVLGEGALKDIYVTRYVLI